MSLLIHLHTAPKELGARVRKRHIFRSPCSPCRGCNYRLDEPECPPLEQAKKSPVKNINLDVSDGNLDEARECRVDVPGDRVATPAGLKRARDDRP